MLLVNDGGDAPSFCASRKVTEWEADVRQGRSHWPDSRAQLRHASWLKSLSVLEATKGQTWQNIAKHYPSEGVCRTKPGFDAVCGVRHSLNDGVIRGTDCYDLEGSAL